MDHHRIMQVDHLVQNLQPRSDENKLNNTVSLETDTCCYRTNICADIELNMFHDKDTILQRPQTFLLPDRR